jgi:hypothetical protein
MSMLSALAMAAAEELNPLLPSPLAVIALLIVGGLVFVALVAAGVFLGMRLASNRRTTETSQAKS